MTIENGNGSATIYNISGELIKTINIRNEKQQINLFDLPKGSYLLRTEKVDGTSKSSRFIKE